MSVREIIRDSMDYYDVKANKIAYESYPLRTPRQADGSRRYFEVKGFAWFNCPLQHHSWPSAHSWCIIDLKTQTICYRYKQTCKKCERTAHPQFTEESIEQMADYVVESYLRRIGRWESPSTFSDDDDSSSVYSDDASDSDEPVTKGGPHHEDRCGKCKHLGRRCCN